MIECIFTIDYEIYGNGQGSLKELVYEPAERLMAIFNKWNACFVPFIEVAELEMIEAESTDPAIDLVKQQVRAFHEGGFEIGLHLHPQWYNARYDNGAWILDYSEYNMCRLPRERIVQIFDRALTYLREAAGDQNLTPPAFRAGNWLFQPTRIVADVLAGYGIKVDSSVFKGGVQHAHALDYRRALKNNYFWRFSDDVNVDDPAGGMLELPIYTRMVPIWKMVTAKRVGLQRKGATAPNDKRKRIYTLWDRLRFRYPLKLDFCRMTLREMTGMVDAILKQEQQNPAEFRPIVAIGHTKDLVDFKTVDTFLQYLKQNHIRVSTFKDVYQKCAG